MRATLDPPLVTWSPEELTNEIAGRRDNIWPHPSPAGQRARTACYLSFSSQIHIKGGCGNDVLSGGSGDDDVQGGNGRDILIGGIGKDKLKGGCGDDLLIGGAVANADHFAAFDAALANWAAGNVAVTLTDLGSISDDGDKDDPKGEQGDDYLIGGASDKLKD